MCKAIMDWMEESKAEGRELTKQVFKSFLARESNEQIADCCGISVEEVVEILA